MRVVCFPSGIPVDYTIQLANYLSLNNDVMIVLSKNQLKDNFEYISTRVNVCVVKNVRHPTIHPANMLGFFETIFCIRRFNPHVIHIQGGDIYSIIMLFFLQNYPLVTTFHDVQLHLGEEKQSLLKIIRYALAKKSKRLFVHGRILKDILIDEYNLPEENVHIISMGEINVEPFKKYMTNNVKESKSVLLFGWIGPRKGLKYLIEAEPLISKKVPDVKIIVAGKVGHLEESKRYFEECLKLIKNQGNFELYPHHITWEFGAQLFQKSSIVVLPYLEVSQSGVIPTAYGFKKPVVVTNVGAMPEIVDDGITGLIIPPENSELLADAIVRLLQNDELRNDMGKKAFIKLKRDLSWDAISTKTVEVYKEIIEKHG